MGFRVVWAPSARLDLKLVSQRIAEHNPEGAQRLVVSILDASKRLAEYPNSGRVVPEFGWETLREIIVGPYRLIYSIRRDRETVEVVRLWHGARGHPLIAP